MLLVPWWYDKMDVLHQWVKTTLIHFDGYLRDADLIAEVMNRRDADMS